MMQRRISVIQGDITKQKVDAIVNAANNSLLGGGGVDGAFHRAAGPGLLCRKLGGCETWVIHTVGPIRRGGNQGEDQWLARCYRSCFTLAEQYSVRTIAFPAISTGAYGFPIQRAARIAITEDKRFLKSNNSMEKVVLVCFDERAYRCYLSALEELVAQAGP